MKKKKMLVIKKEALTADDLFHLALIQGIIDPRQETHKKADHDWMMDKLGHCLLCITGSKIVENVEK